ncbi:hypothetical protein GCM10027517_16350 [Phycicoccus ginsengisoli]
MVLRLLGLQALAGLAATLPPRSARLATLLVLVLANTTPLWAVATGRWAAGDVLVVFWLENVAIGVWTLVRIGTALGALTPTRNGTPAIAVKGGGPIALPQAVARVFFMVFFCIHYGMFTLVHGIFTWQLAHRIGTTGSVRGYLLVLLALVASHGVATGVHWFARGERLTTGPQQAMARPYGRIVVLHVVVLGSAFLLARAGGSLDTAAPVAGATAVLPAVALVVLKTVIDAGLHLRVHRATDAPVPVAVPSA